MSRLSFVGSSNASRWGAVVEEVERYDNDLNGLDLIKNLYADEIEEEIDELIEGMKNLSLS